MLTIANTPAREKEVDDILSVVRGRLIASDFVEVSIEYDVKTEWGDDGFGHNEHTGSFTLRAVHR